MMIEDNHPFWKAGEKYIHPGIYQAIEIDPVLSQLPPPATKRRFKLLEKSIKKRGCIEPIILFHEHGRFLIADGHIRYQICQKHNIPFQVKILPYNNREHVEDYIITNLLFSSKPSSKKTNDQLAAFDRYFDPNTQ